LRNCEICARRLDLSFGWDNPISPRIFLEWLSGPKDLIYALDEKPSPLQLLALGFQRVAVICPYLVMVALVASAAKLPHTEARNAMAWAMIAVGFLTVPQNVRIGRVGSGYLRPRGGFWCRDHCRWDRIGKDRLGCALGRVRCE
jgi:hypothetical protein